MEQGRRKGQLDIVIKKEENSLIRKRFIPLTLRGTKVFDRMEPTTLSSDNNPLLMLVEALTMSIFRIGDPKIILFIQKKS